MEETKEDVKLGIKETKEVVIFLAKLGIAVGESIHSKKLSFTDFAIAAKEIPAALNDITKVPAEVKDLDSQEGKELLEVVVRELEPLGIVSTEAAKKFISAGVNFAEGILDLVAGLKAAKEAKEIKEI